MHLKKLADGAGDGAQLLGFLPDGHHALDSPVPCKLDVVIHSVVLALGKWRQGDQNFKAVEAFKSSLGCMRSYVKNSRNVCCKSYF